MTPEHHAFPEETRLGPAVPVEPDCAPRTGSLPFSMTPEGHPIVQIAGETIVCERLKLATAELPYRRPQTMDEWFLALPPARQAMLRDDKWMLAQAAFIAGAEAGKREANDKAEERRDG